MTLSSRETVLRALLAKIKASVPGAADVMREPLKGQEVPRAGLVIQADGEAELLEELLSVRVWTWRRDATAEIYVKADEDSDWRARLDKLVRDLGAALLADRTLGGAVDHVQTGSPQIGQEDVTGFPGWASALLPISLWYDTADPADG